MNEIYRPVVEHFATQGTHIQIYMDDIAIATNHLSLATRTTDAHLAAVSAVLATAKANDLYFKLDKCSFHVPSMDYLGVILEKGVTHMDPVKVEGVQDWPTPTKVKYVCSFLGFCNVYCPFIQGFANIA